MREHRAAADIVLTPEDFAALDVAFPPPRRKSPLATIWPEPGALLRAMAAAGAESACAAYIPREQSVDE